MPGPNDHSMPQDKDISQSLYVEIEGFKIFAENAAVIERMNKALMPPEGDEHENIVDSLFSLSQELVLSGIMKIVAFDSPTLSSGQTYAVLPGPADTFEIHLATANVNSQQLFQHFICGIAQVSLDFEHLFEEKSTGAVKHDETSLLEALNRDFDNYREIGGLDPGEEASYAERIFGPMDAYPIEKLTTQQLYLALQTCCNDDLIAALITPHFSKLFKVHIYEAINEKLKPYMDDYLEEPIEAPTSKQTSIQGFHCYVPSALAETFIREQLENVNWGSTLITQLMSHAADYTNPQVGKIKLKFCDIAFVEKNNRSTRYLEDDGTWVILINIHQDESGLEPFRFKEHFLNEIARATLVWAQPLENRVLLGLEVFRGKYLNFAFNNDLQRYLSLQEKSLLSPLQQEVGGIIFRTLTSYPNDKNVDETIRVGLQALLFNEEVAKFIAPQFMAELEKYVNKEINEAKGLEDAYDPFDASSFKKITIHGFQFWVENEAVEKIITDFISCQVALDWSSPIVKNLMEVIKLTSENSLGEGEIPSIFQRIIKVLDAKWLTEKGMPDHKSLVKKSTYYERHSASLAPRAILAARSDLFEQSFIKIMAQFDLTLTNPSFEIEYPELYKENQEIINELSNAIEKDFRVFLDTPLHLTSDQQKQAGNLIFINLQDYPKNRQLAEQISHTMSALAIFSEEVCEEVAPNYIQALRRYVDSEVSPIVGFDALLKQASMKDKNELDTEKLDLSQPTLELPPPPSSSAITRRTISSASTETPYIPVDISKFKLIDIAGFQIYVENEAVAARLRTEFERAERRQWYHPLLWQIMLEAKRRTQLQIAKIKIVALDRENIDELSKHITLFHADGCCEIRMSTIDTAIIKGSGLIQTEFMHEISHAMFSLANPHRPLGTAKMKAWYKQLREAICADRDAYEVLYSQSKLVPVQIEATKLLFASPQQYPIKERMAEQICWGLQALVFNAKAARSVASRFIETLEKYVSFDLSQKALPSGDSALPAISVFPELLRDPVTRELSLLGLPAPLVRLGLPYYPPTTLAASASAPKLPFQPPFSPSNSKSGLAVWVNGKPAAVELVSEPSPATTTGIVPQEEANKIHWRRIINWGQAGRALKYMTLEGTKYLGKAVLNGLNVYIYHECFEDAYQHYEPIGQQQGKGEQFYVALAAGTTNFYIQMQLFGGITKACPPLGAILVLGAFANKYDRTEEILSQLQAHHFKPPGTEEELGILHRLTPEALEILGPTALQLSFSEEASGAAAINNFAGMISQGITNLVYMGYDFLAKQTALHPELAEFALFHEPMSLDGSISSSSSGTLDITDTSKPPTEQKLKDPLAPPISGGNTSPYAGAGVQSDAAKNYASISLLRALGEQIKAFSTHEGNAGPQIKMPSGASQRVDSHIDVSDNKGMTDNSAGQESFHFDPYVHSYKQGGLDYNKMAVNPPTSIPQPNVKPPKYRPFFHFSSHGFQVGVAGPLGYKPPSAWNATSGLQQTYQPNFDGLKTAENAFGAAVQGGLEYLFNWQERAYQKEEAGKIEKQFGIIKEEWGSFFERNNRILKLYQDVNKEKDPQKKNELLITLRVELNNFHPDAKNFYKKYKNYDRNEHARIGGSRVRGAVWEEIHKMFPLIKSVVDNLLILDIVIQMAENSRDINASNEFTRQQYERCQRGEISQDDFKKISQANDAKYIDGLKIENHLLFMLKKTHGQKDVKTINLNIKGNDVKITYLANDKDYQEACDNFIDSNISKRKFYKICAKRKKSIELIVSNLQEELKGTKSKSKRKKIQNEIDKHEHDLNDCDSHRDYIVNFKSNKVLRAIYQQAQKDYNEAKIKKEALEQARVKYEASFNLLIDYQRNQLKTATTAREKYGISGHIIHLQNNQKDISYYSGCTDFINEDIDRDTFDSLCRQRRRHIQDRKANLEQQLSQIPKENEAEIKQKKEEIDVCDQDEQNSCDHQNFILNCRTNKDKGATYNKANEELNQGKMTKADLAVFWSEYYSSFNSLIDYYEQQLEKASSEDKCGIQDSIYGLKNDQNDLLLGQAGGQYLDDEIYLGDFEKVKQNKKQGIQNLIDNLQKRLDATPEEDNEEREKIKKEIEAYEQEDKNDQRYGQFIIDVKDSNDKGRDFKNICKIYPGDEILQDKFEDEFNEANNALSSILDYYQEQLKDASPEKKEILKKQIYNAFLGRLNLIDSKHSAIFYRAKKNYIDKKISEGEFIEDCTKISLESSAEMKPVVSEIKSNPNCTEEITNILTSLGDGSRFTDAGYQTVIFGLLTTAATTDMEETASSALFAKAYDYSQQIKNLQKRSDTLMIVGETALREGKPDVAKKIADCILSDNPKHHDAFLLLIRTLKALKEDKAVILSEIDNRSACFEDENEKIINRYMRAWIAEDIHALEASLAELDGLNRGWDLCLISELSDDSNVLPNKVYLEKVDGRLRYLVIAPDGKKTEDFLDISVEGDLTKETLSILQRQILDEISKRGHAPNRDLAETMRYLKACLAQLTALSDDETQVAREIADVQAVPQEEKLIKYYMEHFVRCEGQIQKLKAERNTKKDALAVKQTELAAKNDTTQADSPQTDASNVSGIEAEVNVLEAEIKAIEADIESYEQEQEDVVKTIVKKSHFTQHVGNLRKIELLSYGHLAVDSLMLLFKEFLEKHYKLTEKQFNVSSQVVSQSVNLISALIQDAIRRNHNPTGHLLGDGVTDMNKALHDAGAPDNFTGMLGKVATKAQADKTVVENIHDGLSRANSLVTAFKLASAVTDFVLLRRYEQACDELKNQGQPELLYDVWLQQQGSLIQSAASANVVVHHGTDIYRHVQLLLSMYLFTIENANPLTLLRKATMAFFNLSYLRRAIDYAMSSDDGSVSENELYQAYTLLMEHMYGSGWQQLVYTHEDTFLNGFKELFHRFGAEGIAKFLSVHAQTILNVLSLGRTIFGIKNVMTVHLPQRMLEVKLNNLQRRFHQLSFLSESARTYEEKKHIYPIVSNEFEKLKQGVMCLDRHLQRARLYVESLISQHLTARTAEIKRLSDDSHCLFTAISLYTEESAMILRQKTIDYLRTHRADFESRMNMPFDDYLAKAGELGDIIIIEALSGLLQRPIIILFKEEQLEVDLQRQGLDKPDAIIEGHPIFVVYEPVGESDADGYHVHGLYLRREDYFERQQHRNVSQNRHLPLQKLDISDLSAASVRAELKQEEATFKALISIKSQHPTPIPTAKPPVAESTADAPISATVASNVAKKQRLSGLRFFNSPSKIGNAQTNDSLLPPTVTQSCATKTTEASPLQSIAELREQHKKDERDFYTQIGLPVPKTSQSPATPKTTQSIGGQAFRVKTGAMPSYKLPDAPSPKLSVHQQQMLFGSAAPKPELTAVLKLNDTKMSSDHYQHK